MSVLDEIIQLSRVQEDKRSYGIELVSILDYEARTQYLSPMHLAALGYDTDELLGKCMLDYVHPNDMSNVRLKFMHLVQTGDRTTVEFRFRHKDGRWIEVKAEGAPLIENDILHGFLIVSNTRRCINIQALMRELTRLCADQNLNL